jgi:hypothetical protein
MGDVAQGAGLTRRRFVQLAAVTATAATLDAGLRPAASGFTWRYHGPIMTRSTLDDLADCMRQGGYDAKKVITAAWGSPSGGAWTQADRARVLFDIPGITIVRTLAGDQGFPHNFPDPERVVAELRPWWELHHGIWAEIGNEPNTQEWSADERARNDWLWTWRYLWGQAIDRCRQEFPGATFISPGLGPLEEEAWHIVCGDVFARADKIGFHAFTPNSFVTDQDWLGRILPVLGRHDPDRRWFLIEYGVHNPAMAARDKGAEYAGMVHFGQSRPALPSNVEGAVYFHLDTARTREPEYHIYDRDEASSGDTAYRVRKG